ncbi:ATP-grasp domain-containing protein [Actinomadura madurae]|nr:ATP-grasp domain-containing protein [Actinomadura madurae]
MRKVLIANRGEIAVRIARACRDAGLASVAVYAEPDLEALHVRVADEAFALGGRTAAESYLDIGKLLKIAAESGADAVHPGYGFLAENADFATAVENAGLTWIGPPPAAITALGDKVQARHIAQKVGAPLVAGTKDPVSGADEVVAFAEEHGLPIAIKAAFGGGGRGLKVARALDEVAELYESAVREAVGAFGRGECFVERYLDKPRHVETQCLADKHGNVVVVSTRDCSLQRRHQKLVEEAPAPYLSGEQLDLLYGSSKAILKEAGYVGAGTCEFLVGQDGTISFLEVNTRLQVEHPVTEEVAGVDLVREMFRIADGEELGYGDPELRGHSIEFRLNAEDAGRGFLPAVGTLTGWRPPTGPGVRLDAGYEAGQTVPQEFDSLVAKLIVTGATRPAGRRAVPPGARRVRHRGDADRPAVPPGGAGRPGVRPGGRRGAVRRPHPVDRDGVREHDPAARGARAGRGGTGRAGARHRRGRRRRIEVVLPAGLGASAAPAGPGQARPAARRAEGRRRAGVRRLPGQPDAGHHRQDRRRGRRDRGGRRHHRRAGGHEDGAAAHRPQGGDAHRAVRRGRPDRLRRAP